MSEREVFHICFDLDFDFALTPSSNSTFDIENTRLRVIKHNEHIKYVKILGL